MKNTQGCLIKGRYLSLKSGVKEYLLENEHIERIVITLNTVRTDH